MHVVPINFSDPGFNPAYVADFELIILLNQNSFDYAVRHFETQRLVRVSTGNALADLWQATEGSGLMASAYQKISIAAETNSFCLIPDAIFTPENLLDYAAFLLIKEADVILTDKLGTGENTVIFTFPAELVRLIENRYPSTKIQFAPKSWIKTTFGKNISGQNLYLFLEENRLKILFPNQENIRFYNQFDCVKTDEMVYYVALVANQLKLKPEETSLLICGGIVDESEQILRLQEFFKDVKLLTNENFTQKNELQYHQIVQFLGLS